MITFKKDLATFVPSPKATTWNTLDVELGVQLRDTFANNPRLIECVTMWRWLRRDALGWGVEISVETTYQRMPSKVRIALENDIRDTLKEFASGVLIIKSSRMISKIN